MSEHVSAALSACLPHKSPLLSEIPHRPWFVQRELANANACLFCVKQSCFFPSCFWVVATRGKGRWGGGTLSLKYENHLKKQKMSRSEASERGIYLKYLFKPVCDLLYIFPFCNVETSGFVSFAKLANGRQQRWMWLYTGLKQTSKTNQLPFPSQR